MPDELSDFEGRSGDDRVFIEDGRPLSVNDLLDGSRELSERLEAWSARRVAVDSASPHRLAIAMMSCAKTGHEVLIVRARREPQQVAASLGASLYIDEYSNVHSLPVEPRRPESAGGVLIATSGTTGTPKVVRHCLSALTSRIRPARARGGSAKWLLTYESGGFAGIQMILTALLTRSVLVALRDRSATALADAAMRERVTHISGTPTFWRSFLVCLGPDAMSLPIEQITLGGEIADQKTLDRLRAMYPKASISHIYASTEAGALFSVRDGRAGFPASWLSSGIEGSRLRIRDGVLEVQTARGMQAYVNSIPTPYTEDAWLRTGDRVQLEGNRVFFQGRDDTLINVGGTKVVPEDVEAAFLGVAGVIDVRVIPIQNPITGFIVGVEVVKAPGVDPQQLQLDLLRLGRAKLDAVRSPRIVRFVDHISIDPSGKKSRTHGS